MIVSRAYLKAFLTGMLGVLFAAGALNLIVDPYRLLDWKIGNSVAPIKSRTSTQIYWSKAQAIPRFNPNGLIMGSSRVDVGLDPNHLAWPESSRPVYNLGMPGGGIYQALRYLQHTLATSKPQVVVLGLDFNDFRTNPIAALRPKTYVADFEKRLRLPSNSDYTIQSIKDAGRSLFSLTATADSFRTLLAQGKPDQPDITSAGFNPLNEYNGFIREEGHWNMFRQKSDQNIIRDRRMSFSVRKQSGELSRPAENLVEFISMCRENNIDLRLFIHPYHAYRLESYRLTGGWEVFEDWKRLLTEITGDNIPLWDFSGYNSITIESVPEKGDNKTKMDWFWEPSHYKKEAGDLVLNRIFNRPSPDMPADFGILLTRANLEEQLARIRQDQMRYVADSPGVVAEFAGMVEM